MRISDWSSDGCSSDLPWLPIPAAHRAHSVATQEADPDSVLHGFRRFMQWRKNQPCLRWGDISFLDTAEPLLAFIRRRSEEHTSELQSLMRISYAVFCLKKKRQ